MFASPPVLKNATRRDVHVLVSGHLVLLPSIASPSVLDDGEATPLEIQPAPSLSTVIEVIDPRPTLSLMLPPPEEGVLYLVDAEILLRFPHRQDFVTPAHYQLQPGSDDEPFRSVLVAVYSSLQVVPPTLEALALGE